MFLTVFRTVVFVAGGDDERDVADGGVAGGDDERDVADGGVAEGDDERDVAEGDVAEGDDERDVPDGDVAEDREEFPSRILMSLWEVRLVAASRRDVCDVR
jgi:hypothetical protein